MAVFAEPSTFLWGASRSQTVRRTISLAGSSGKRATAWSPSPSPLAVQTTRRFPNIQPHDQVGEGFRTSKGAHGNFPVIVAVTRRLGVQPDGFGILAAVPGGKFKSLGGMKAAFPAASGEYAHANRVWRHFGELSSNKCGSGVRSLRLPLRALRKWMGLREARLRGIEAD